MLILFATSTLASGVNLPARRVIFKTPYIGRSFLDATRYQQMKGRAGRKGHDEYGESFLIFIPADRPKVAKLMKENLQPAESKATSMERSILELVYSKTVKTFSDVESYVAQTFFFHGK